MITLQWTKGQTTGSREFRTQAMADRFAAGLERTGYTIVKPVETETEQTGRAGHGLATHRIVGGVAHCGASYRSRTLGGTLATTITGEAIDCTRCLAH